MPIGLHNPLPSSLASECGKAARILRSFIDPNQALGADKVIPPSLLAQAKGYVKLAILTVVKGGFLASVRLGSGLVIARLPDGSWSAPSALATAGAGFGGQIGAELTDFVMILNDSAAVKTFSQAGSVTLGGNVSIAAGPVGRNAEASGAASLQSVAGIFSYSQTKGLFAGVSLEGSVLVERKDANRKFYNADVSAKQLLSGSIPAPPAADALLQILSTRIFRGGRDDDMLSPDVIPELDSHSSRNGEERINYADRSRRTATWRDDIYDRDTISSQTSPVTRRDTEPFSNYRNKGPAPGRPTAPKPIFKAPSRQATLGPNQAIALYSFEGDQEGDLSFKKGDIINIIKRTESKNDWWTGELRGKVGIFPSNYVEAA